MLVVELQRFRARNSPLYCVNEVRAQVRGWNNTIQRADVESALHAMHAVEFGGHFAQFFRVDDLEQLFPLRKRSARTLA